MTAYRANYALVDVMEYLGWDDDALDAPWAEFVGDESSRFAFEVPTADPVEAYVQLQAYDVGSFGHEIVVNGDPLSGFDIPPADGWQYWMDSMTGTDLREGENTLRFRRDTDTDDNFVVGTVAIHWKEPVADTG